MLVHPIILKLWIKVKKHWNLKFIICNKENRSNVNVSTQIKIKILNIYRIILIKTKYAICIK